MGIHHSHPQPQPVPAQQIHQQLQQYHNKKVLLYSPFSKHHLRANNEGFVDARGANDANSHWILHHHGQNEISLQAPHSGFLREDHVYVSATGIIQDPYCKFQIVHHNEDGSISFKSHSGHGLGFAGDGAVRPPHECGEGPHTRFIYEANL